MALMRWKRILEKSVGWRRRWNNFAAVDKDQNGKFEIGYLDKNDDGTVDVVGFDHNEDGEWDEFKKLK